MDVQTYKAILDSINSPIVFVGNDHRILYLNKAAKIKFSYEKHGFPNLVGKSLFDCHHPASRNTIERLHDRLLAGESEIFLNETKEQEKITMIAVRDDAGQLLGYYERFEKNAGEFKQ